MAGKDLQLPKNHYALTLSSEWLLLPDAEELQKLNSKEITAAGHSVFVTEYKRKTSEEFFFTAVLSGVDSDSKSVNSAGNILIMKYSAGTGKVETNWDSVPEEFRFFFPRSLEIALGYLTTSRSQLTH